MKNRLLFTVFLALALFCAFLATRVQAPPERDSLPALSQKLTQSLLRSDARAVFGFREEEARSILARLNGASAL